MKMRVSGILVALAGVGASFVGCGDQPKTNCRVLHGEYAVKYTVKTAPTGAGCTTLTSETLGAEPYFTTLENNYTPTVAVQPSGLETLVDDPDVAGTGTPISVGHFTATFPDDKNECQIADLPAGVVNVPP